METGVETNPSTKDVLAKLRPEFEKRSAPYEHKESALLALLHAVQTEYGFITGEAEAAVSEFLGVGANRVHEAVTFYTLYKTKPAGKFHLQVCRTLSCDVCGAPELLDVIRKKAGIGDRETSADGVFSLETVECLGCCELAPAIQVNQEPFRGPMTPDMLGSLLDELKAKAGSNGNGAIK